MTVRGGRGPREPMAVPATGDEPEGRRLNAYERTGRYGRGPGDPRRDGRYRSRSGGFLTLVRFTLFMGVLAVGVLLVMITVARPLTRAIIVPLADSNPGLLRFGFVEDFVREDLGASLTDPAGINPAPIEFTVESGDTPALLAPRLKEAGIIASERAFLFQAEIDGLAPQLTAGRFLLAGNLTPAQVVTGLIDNRVVIETADITFREGLRLEQMTAKLQTVTGTAVDPKAFYQLVVDPPDELLADYPWLLDENVRPKGTSLEGFLYPATYTLRVDEGGQTTTEELVRMMLDAFYANVGEARLQVPDKRGLTFYQVLTLASLVEREAVLDKERPLIAGVYQNRIDRLAGVKHGLLQADPTVIYAVDSVKLGKYSDEWQRYTFWTVPAGAMAEQQLPDRLAAYNTYAVRGLPPGPICTPSLASLDAALVPSTKAGYIFFVAIPEGKGAHDFSKTLAEHQAKLRKYGY